MTKARDIADGVDTADIADGAISTAKLADGSISTAKIADSAISAAKIADGDITDAKLATGISASKLTGSLPAVDGSALTGVGGGGFIPRGRDVITTTSTYTVPAGATLLRVHVIGGGAAGGGSSVVFGGGGGGGAGGYSMGYIDDLVGGDTVSVTIGAGGVGVLGDAASNSGGTTSFGTYLTATGGSGSTQGSGNTSFRSSSGGDGGTGSGGYINSQGGKGGFGYYHGSTPNRYPHGGGGGGMFTGNGSGTVEPARVDYYNDGTLVKQMILGANNTGGVFGNYIPELSHLSTGFTRYVGDYTRASGVTYSQPSNGQNATAYGCGGSGSAGQNYTGGSGKSGVVVVEYN